MRDRTKDGPKSAAELMAELARDPQHVARTQEREQRQRADAEAYAAAAGPLLAELQTAGLSVTTVRELKQSGAAARAAVPILLRWLPRVEYAPLKEDIVRTLSVPWAKPDAAAALIAEFERTDPQETGIRWAIANALAVVADEAAFDELARLARDKSNGKSREMLAVALGNIAAPRAVTVLIDLLDDDEVTGHAVMALGKLRASAARPRIADLQRHPIAWVRQEATKALELIDGGTK